ncbi:MAG: protein kinase [Planctomycetota bacterium]
MAEVRKIGNFELLERIGQGGMGTVFKARQVSMDRIVALKILPPSLAKQPTFTDRFVREARASAKLSHLNIVGGIDVGQDGGVYYFAMEFVDGQSVKQLLAKGKLPEEQVLKIGKAMALALAHAHEQGILHRDVKPDNILIDKSGTPKLCDLGLARQAGQGEAEHGLTQQGTTIGTPHYIAPEQARGMDDLDAKADLYSLGASLYHMLTGKTMFQGSTNIVVMTKHITDKCPSPGEAGVEASKGLVAILAKLLAKDRADRYESAAKLADDITLVAQGKPPRHAELPPAKWPFSGALPGAPAKKATAIAATAPVERPRVSRRETRPGSKTANHGWLVPVCVAGIAAIALLSFLGGQSRDAGRSQAKAPASAKDATANPSARNAPGLPPASSLPAKAGVLPHGTPQADTSGSRKADEKASKVPDLVGLAAPPPAEPTPPAKAAAAPTPPEKAENTLPNAPKVQVGEAAGPEKPAAAQEQKPEETDKVTAGPELAGLISKALALSAESKFRDAANQFKLQPEKLQQWDGFDRELARIHAEAYAGLAEMKPLIAERLNAEPNKIEANKFLSKTFGGKLAGCDEKNLHIKDSGADLQYAWEKLSHDELYALNRLVFGNLPANISLGLGVLAYDQHTDKDDAFAHKVLNGVTSATARKLVELIVLRDKVTLAKKQAVQNAYAEKLFYELEEAMANAKFAAVSAKAAALRAKYAQTEVMKHKGAELSELVELADAARKAGAATPPGNVALASNGATCTGSATAANLIDGNTTEYNLNSGYAWCVWPGEFIVTLPKICVLRQIRVLLWDGELDRFYRYAIETSLDGEKYMPLVDHSKGEWRSWQQIDLAPRPVKTIKLKGLFGSSNPNFHAVQLEAYCIPPEKPATPKVAPPHTKNPRPSVD